MQRSRPICLCLPVLALTAAATAQQGSALLFDAEDDCVFVPYDDSFPVEVFTASAWVKTPGPVGGNGAIIGRGEDDDSYNFAWQLYINGLGNLQLTLEDSRERNYCYPRRCQGGGNDKSCTITGDLFISDDEWHHIAATRNAAGLVKMYVDGVAVVSCTDTGTPSPNNQQYLTIGCTHFFIGPPPEGEEPTDWFFPGVIDEPAMWSVALSDAEIADVVANGIDPEATGLAGLWLFDEGAGQAVQDGSSSGNHGFRGETEDPDDDDPAWITLDPVCPEDIDGSGSVDLGDLLAVLAAWGPCADCPEDLDDSGDVGFADLLLVIAGWGACESV